MLEHKLNERPFEDQPISNLVLVERKKLPQTLQEKTISEESWVVVRKTAS